MYTKHLIIIQYIIFNLGRIVMQRYTNIYMLFFFEQKIILKQNKNRKFGKLNIYIIIKIIFISKSF